MELKTVELKSRILESNEIEADCIRRELKEKNVFLLNIMSSPGAGKTTTLLRTLQLLQNKMKIGIMEADIDSAVDAERILQVGGKAIQLHTGGMCHLDASMTRQGLDAFGVDDLDLVILENVGNLVCPAEFDTGAMKNVVILSVPEGDDKPLKYPLIFSVCDVLLISKTDVLPYFDFNMRKIKDYALSRNPNIKIIPISAKTGEGFHVWLKWLTDTVFSGNQKTAE